MEVIEKRRWLVDENKLFTYLMSFYLEISYTEYYSVLTVIDKDKDYLNLKFANLENVLNFIETEVVYSYSLCEVEDRFHGFNKHLRKSKNKTKKR